jgi:ATP-dependent helicase HepA
VSKIGGVVVPLEERVVELLEAEFALTRNQIASRLRVSRPEVGRVLREGAGTRFQHDGGSPPLWSLAGIAPTVGVVSRASGETPAHVGVHAEHEDRVGQLVRWPGASDDGLGVVTGVHGGQISVSFDSGADRIFALEGAPLERVTLQGQVIRRSTGDAGFVIDGPLGRPPRWTVALPGANGQFSQKLVPESDLRPHVSTSPVERMKLGQTAGPRQANLALIARHYDLEHRTNDLVSLGQARVDLKPYQVAVVHRVVTSYPHRFLLCDEVGLGKTIEAGMILKELRARGNAGRTLIIVPPNLVRQWQFELKSKFNEPFSVLNTATVKYLKNTGYEGNPFAWNDSVIVSSGWITNKPEYAELATGVDWDMVILDEAHHARLKRYGNKVETTRLYRLMRQLAAPDRFSNRALLLLTATPMQLERHELYSLVEMLDPALFPSEDHFEDHQREVPGLNRLVDALHRHGFPVPNQEPDETVALVARWLDSDEVLVRKRLEAGLDEITSLRVDLAERHLLSEVLIRNRKSVVGGFMPRRAHRWEVTLTPAEVSALEAVEDYVAGGWDRATRTSDNAVGFVMTILQKLMASSIWALRQSLHGRRARLAGDITTPLAVDLEDEDAEATAKIEKLSAHTNGSDGEIRELDALVQQLSAIPVDSKAQTLLERLRMVFNHRDVDGDHDCSSPRSHDKVLIFTEFRETQNYLRGLLEAEGWAVHLFHGQMPAERKDEAVAAFRDGAGPQILVSTEAGGEGRNFQFCHMLVNYDLPWNPMRVEQRIGRVDRIGQDHVVEVFNLWVKGTIEERVLDVLERRINVFEETVGGLDPILGTTERSLREILRRRDADRDRALAELEQQLEDQVRQARAAERKLRDFIMDTKSFSRAIAERVSGQTSPITPEAQETFITQLLADVNTWIGPMERGEREIAFHEPFISDFKEFSADGAKRRVVFRAEDVQDAEHVEYFAFGHPIVDALKDRVLDERYEGNAGTRRLLADEALPPTAGWLATYVVSVPGLARAEELHPVFVHDDGRLDTETGWALLRRAAQFRRGAERVIPPEELPHDTLDESLEKAQHHITAIADQLQSRIADESRAQADRERARVVAFFDYREQTIQDKIDATRATLRRLQASVSEDDQRVVPLWRSNLERADRLAEGLAAERARRLSDIDQRLNPTADLALTSLTRIEVVPRG